MNYLKGLPLLCKGEDYGICDDFYFEDGVWKLRHLVVSDAAFVFKKRSLVSPESIDRVELASNGESIPLLISKAAIESAPEFDSELPFSREMEVAALSHYQLNPYWVSGDPGSSLGLEYGHESSNGLLPEELPQESDRNLRSLGEVLGYDVRNNETSLGKVCDLILDISDYSVAYLAVDTKPSEEGGVRIVSTTQEDVGLSIDYLSKCFRTRCSSHHLQECPSADLSEGRLTIGDQQKVDLSSY